MDKRKSPIPSYAGISTFMRAPVVDVEKILPGMIAIFGVPHDTGTRQGSRLGPKTIREASVHFKYYIETGDRGELCEMSSGRMLRWIGDDKITDLGDINIYPNDVVKTCDSISATMEKITVAGAFPVMLGGDHTIAFPGVRGFVDGLRRKNPKARVGLLHFDAHLDLGDDNPVMGKLFDGTPIRRVCELDAINPRNIAMIGIRGLARKDQVEFIKNRGIHCYTMKIIRERGLMNVLKEACHLAGEGCDALYVTLDIDVVDPVYAPGNGGIAFGGITSTEFLEVAEMLSKESKVGALDLVEVNPNYDPAEITAKLASSAILTFLTPKLFEIC